MTETTEKPAAAPVFGATTPEDGIFIQKFEFFSSRRRKTSL